MITGVVTTLCHPLPLTLAGSRIPVLMYPVTIPIACAVVYGSEYFGGDGEAEIEPEPQKSVIEMRIERLNKESQNSPPAKS